MSSFLLISFRCSATQASKSERTFFEKGALSVTRKDAVQGRAEPHIAADWNQQQVEVLLPINSDLSWVSSFLSELDASDYQVDFLDEVAWKSQSHITQDEIAEDT